MSRDPRSILPKSTVKIIPKSLPLTIEASINSLPLLSYSFPKTQNKESPKPFPISLSLSLSLSLKQESHCCMAMSGTGTMSNNPNDWLQFYNQTLSSSQAQVPHGHISSGINTSTFFGHEQVSEATVVTTAPSAAATTSVVGSANPGSSTNSLSPDQGRILKPARKRSRASRRTPTTLLNTDTSNFRAMVQQFTGGPNNTASLPSGASSFSFGLAPPRPQGFVVPQAYHPLQLQQQQHHQYQQQQRQNQQYLVGAGVGDGLLQGWSSSASRGGPTNMGFGGSSVHVVDHHEFLRENMSSSQVPTAARPASNSVNENRSSSFMF